ncbi:hypothetical protein HanPI659440_Chr16g0641131 [Helianthus annuus]|nr:hypothetical protein HanPI659440_Chr16g0641131 [Helianthus annuus]
MAAGAATSSVGVTIPAGSAAFTAAELTSPTRVSKKRKIFTVPALIAFEAIQAAYALPVGSTAGVQVDGVSSAPLTSVDTMPSITSGPSLSELILQASATATVSCSIPPLMPMAAVAVTTSPVSTSLPSSITPTSLFDFVTAMSDVGGSSSGIADDGARLGDDLYLPIINWDPNVQGKRYQPRWKIAESSRLIFPPVIQHWVERAYPPAESAYVEGLNNGNLMNTTMVDSISQPRRLAEIRVGECMITTSSTRRGLLFRS